MALIVSVAGLVAVMGQGEEEILFQNVSPGEVSAINEAFVVSV